MFAVRHLVVLTSIALASSGAFGQSASTPAGLAFDGVLEINGSPLSGSQTVSFEVLSPDGLCLLWRETQTVSVDADGGFSTLIGANVAGSSRDTTADGSLQWGDIFRNGGSALRASGASNCSSGYTPSLWDRRRIRVKVGATTLSPDFDVASVPNATMAGDAYKLGGKQAFEFLQVGGDTQQNKVDDLMVPARHAKLLSLADATPGAPALLPVAPPIQPNDAANKLYCDSNIGGRPATAVGGVTSADAGKVIRWSGTAWEAGSALPSGTNPGDSMSWTGTSWVVSAGLPLTPTSGQYLQFNSGTWQAVNLPSSVSAVAAMAPLFVDPPSTAPVVRFNSASAGNHGYVLRMPMTAGQQPTFMDPSGFAVVPGGQSSPVPFVIGTTNSQTVHLATLGLNRVTILPSGQIGFGTATPSAPFDFAMPAQFTPGTAASPGVLIGSSGNTGLFSPAASELAVSTGGLERLRITASGSVGIGTSNPMGVLDVSPMPQAAPSANAIRIQAPGSTGASTAGGIVMVGGSAPSTGNGGNVVLQGGSSTSGVGGSVDLVGGNTTTMQGGVRIGGSTEGSPIRFIKRYPTQNCSIGMVNAGGVGMCAVSALPTSGATAVLPGDDVRCSPTTGAADLMLYSCRVTSAGVVTIFAFNGTGANATPSPTSWNIIHTKFAQ